MKAFVITILDNKKSQAAADKCIASAKRFHIAVEKFKAITPADDPEKIAASIGLRTNMFKDVYSRYLNSLSAFLSHYHLWKHCIELNEPIIIFEHDAFVVDELPIYKPFDKLMSIGKPSYGKFNNGEILGVNKLFSKQYLPGAHAYMLKPEGAKEIVDCAPAWARPTDVYLNNEYFPWIQEYFPWPVEVKDTFTTIQGMNGCIAKHSYNEAYEII